MDGQTLPGILIHHCQETNGFAVTGTKGHKVVCPQTWFRRCGLSRTQEPSVSQSRPRLGCLAGTLSPSRRQIRSTRLWFTLHPSHCSMAVTRRYPYRPYRLASQTTAIVRASSSSATVAVYLCVDRGCSSARQARRSEMPYRSRANSTHLRRRAGLRSFPVLPPSESGCPTSGPLPHA